MLILASTSTTRQSLLSNAGIKFKAIPPRLDEELLHHQLSDLNAGVLARSLAQAKALSVSNLYQDKIVIGADQTLEFNGKIYHKPSNRLEAKVQLLELRGHTHDLNSAVACAENGEIIWHYQDQAKLKMRTFTDQFLESYLDTSQNDVLSSVGAYKLEGFGIQLFEDIEGDYFTILGFPLLRLLKFLRSKNIVSS